MDASKQIEDQFSKLHPCFPVETKIAIVGAGPSGLSAAYALAKLGYLNVTVFERYHAVAGMCESVDIEDKPGNYQDMEVADDYVAIMPLTLKLQDEASKSGYIGVHAVAKLHLIQLLTSLNYMASPFVPKSVAYGYTASGYGFVQDMPYAYVQEFTRTSMAGKIRRLKGGYTSMWQKLSDSLPYEVLCNTEVLKVSRNNDGASVLIQDAVGEQKLFEFDKIIVSGALPFKNGKIYRESETVAGLESEVLEMNDLEKELFSIDMKSGYYEKLERELQGSQEYLLCWGLMAFELTERNSSYAIAMRLFPLVSSHKHQYHRQLGELPELEFPELPSLDSYLRFWGTHSVTENKTLYSWINEEGQVVSQRTYKELHANASLIAHKLTTSMKPTFKPGDRVLLVHLPGLEFVDAFFGCIRAKLIPVPVLPPDPLQRGGQALLKIENISKTCNAVAILSTSSYHAAVRAGFVKQWVTLSTGTPKFSARWPDLPWIHTDSWIKDSRICMNDSNLEFSGRGVVYAEPKINDICFLQFTSGSTGEAKGVMITHDGLIHNIKTMRKRYKSTSNTILVSWLPQYHDMGLIGGLFTAMVSGGTAVLFSPMTFIRNPLLWLQTMSKYKATHSAGPNFAFELVIRRLEANRDKPQAFDLSSMIFLMVAAEPVRQKTMKKFIELCHPFGLSQEVMAPGYGLAENCVFVSCAFGKGKPVFVDWQGRVCCGYVDSNDLDVEIRIVDPETGRQHTEHGKEGEIWIQQSQCWDWQKPSQLEEDLYRSLTTGTADGRRQRSLSLLGKNTSLPQSPVSGKGINEIIKFLKGLVSRQTGMHIDKISATDSLVSYGLDSIGVVRAGSKSCLIILEFLLEQLMFFTSTCLTQIWRKFSMDLLSKSRPQSTAMPSCGLETEVDILQFDMESSRFQQIGIGFLQLLAIIYASFLLILPAYISSLASNNFLSLTSSVISRPSQFLLSLILAPLAWMFYIILTCFSISLFGNSFLQPNYVLTPEVSIWSIDFVKWWALNKVQEIASKVLAVHLRGTVFLRYWFEMFGARIGSSVLIDTVDITDPSLVSIGEGVVIAEGVLIQSHEVRNGVLSFLPVRIGRNASVGPYAVIQKGSILGEDAIVSPLQKTEGSKPVFRSGKALNAPKVKAQMVSNKNLPRELLPIYHFLEICQAAKWDRSLLHLPTYHGCKSWIVPGSYSSCGYASEKIEVHENSVIGSQSLVLSGSVIQEGVMLGALSIAPMNSVLQKGGVYVGSQTPTMVKNNLHALDERIEEMDMTYKKIVGNLAGNLAITTMKVKSRYFHRIGVSGKGVLKMYPDLPGLPKHKMFHSGKSFPVIIRHSNSLSADDDARIDARGASIRILSNEGNKQLPLLDLTLKSGKAFYARTITDFANWLVCGLPAREQQVKRAPHIREAVWGSLRNTNSYTELHYYSNICRLLRFDDGQEMYVKFKLRPFDFQISEDSGKVEPKGILPPETGAIPREESDKRPLLFLADDFQTRVNSPDHVRYVFQLQLRPVPSDEADREVALDCTKPWDETMFPYLEIGEITIDQNLTAEDSEKLEFNPFYRCHEVDVIRATSSSQSASIDHGRSLIYEICQHLRNGHPLPGSWRSFIEQSDAKVDLSSCPMAAPVATKNGGVTLARPWHKTLWAATLQPLLQTFIPYFTLGLIIYAPLQWMLLIKEEKKLMLYWLLPFYYVVSGIMAALVCALAKWVLVGRKREGDTVMIWSWGVFMDTLWQALRTVIGDYFMEMTCGSFLFGIWMRFMGSEVGEGVYVDSMAALLNPEMVEIERGGAVGRDAVLFGHIYEGEGGKVKYGKVRVCEGGFVGSRAVAMPGVVVDTGGTLSSLSIAMKDEIVRPR
ncbi:hypothetical protein J5N97_026203 [Dioscorea zingiberensis]|uniref:4-coumarate--CoA ligase n=1 Tax=Dioscorea zingiberensis TaxID=325984 RepID=A0A9D5C2F3_9LILI|nr:hypothetical protein J5N97_026203 [Dioscorea zingiberensis]